MTSKPNYFALNPTAILFVVNAFGALIVAWGGHFTTAQLGIVDGIITAVITLIVTIMTRPIHLQLLVGGAFAVIQALSPFVHQLDLTAAQISSGSIVLSLILACFFHLTHTPVAAEKLGTTSDALQGVKTPAV
jgi:hypothetical protein